MSDQNLAEMIEYNARQGYTKDELQRIQGLFGVDPSGSWDSPTVERLLDWQRSCGIEADGKAWRSPSGNTWSKLDLCAKAHEVADLVQLMRGAGLSVVDERVPPRPYPFSPKGVIVHHTATGGSKDLPTLRIAREGRSGLQGPLCQFLLGRQGTVAVISEGHSNHAGKGRKGVLEQVKSGQPVDPGGEADEVGGNQWFYGIEIENNGTGEVFPEVQYSAGVRITATLCRHFGWSERAVIGHKEWTRRKSDPAFDMDEFRTAVAAELSSAGVPNV